MSCGLIRNRNNKKGKKPNNVTSLEVCENILNKFFKEGKLFSYKLKLVRIMFTN